MNNKIINLSNLAVITDSLEGEGKGLYPTFNGIGSSSFYQIFQINKQEFSNTKEISKKILDKSIKALIIFGDGINPNVIFDEGLDKISENLDVLVYSNHLKNEIFEIADYVIPTKTYAEQNSTVINLVGKIKKAPKTTPTVDIITANNINKVLLKLLN